MPWPKPKRSEQTRKGGESSAQTNHLDTSPTPNETKRSRFLGVFKSRPTSRSPSPRPPSPASPEPRANTLGPSDQRKPTNAAQNIVPVPAGTRNWQEGNVAVTGPTGQDQQHEAKVEQNPNAHQQQQVAPYDPGVKGGGKGLWYEAYDKLPDELKKHLGVDKLQTLKNVLGAAIDAKEGNIANQLKLKWGDKEINVRETTDRLVGWITKFKEIGDIAVQYDPVHAALPWAGVRFILLVNSHYIHYLVIY